MAVTSAEDVVASRLNSSISESSEELTVNYEFTSMTVPPEGWLVVGKSSHLSPGSDGTPPEAEVIKYTSFSRNGDGTSTFGQTTDDPLDRGVGNTSVRAWNGGTPVGLSQSAEYINLILSALVPQNDGNFIFQNIHSDSQINTALQPGGVNELDIKDWYEKSMSGIVTSGDVGNVVTTQLADGETIKTALATLIESNGQPVDSGVDLIIATLDNGGGGTSQATILSGDGSTVYDKVTGSPIASYSNSSGGAQTIMIGADNGHFNTGSGSDQDLYVAVVAKVV